MINTMRIINLNREDILLRKLHERHHVGATPIKNYKWYEFNHDAITFEIWEDAGTLYYRGEVKELFACDDGGYVVFEVIDTPIKREQEVIK